MRKKIVLLSLLAACAVFTSGCMTLDFFKGPAPAAPVPATADNPVRAYDSAKKLLAKKQYEQALGAFDEFIKNYPDNPLTQPAMFYRGDTYKGQGKDDEAIAAYQRVIDKYGSGSWARLATMQIEKLKNKNP